MEYIDSQQDELDRVLTTYENEIRNLSQQGVLGYSSGSSPADEERERTYTLAENLNKELDEMAQSIGEMIKEVNAGGKADDGSGVTGDDDDPVGMTHDVFGLPNAIYSGVKMLF